MHVRFICNAAGFRTDQEVEVTPENEPLLRRLYERGKCVRSEPAAATVDEVTEPEPVVTSDVPESGPAPDDSPTDGE